MKCLIPHCSHCSKWKYCAGFDYDKKKLKRRIAKEHGLIDCLEFCGTPEWRRKWKIHPSCKDYWIATWRIKK